MPPGPGPAPRHALSRRRVLDQSWPRALEPESNHTDERERTRRSQPLWETDRVSVSHSGAATATSLRVIRARLVLAAVVLVLLAGAGFAAVRLIHRTEVLGIARVEARSDDVSLTIVASHNDCNNDPAARIVRETSDAVTVRAERRRDFPADACDDIGEQTQFRLVLTEPLGARTILVDAPYGPIECVVDGVASGRCVAVGQ